MNQEELRAYIKNNYVCNGKLKITTILKKEYGDLLYSFESRGSSFLENLYLFYYNVDPSICPECGKRTKFIKFSDGYRTYCSTKCSSNSSEKKEAIKNTNVNKYGHEYAFQSKDAAQHRDEYFSNLKDEEYNKKVVEKRKQTNIERYGNDNPYGYGTKNFKQILIDRYGVEYYSQTDEYNEKVKQTSQERYGVDSPSQCAKVKEKIASTNEERYGVKYVMQSENIRNRQKENVKEKYGVDNVFKSKEIKTKITTNNKNKFGVEYSSQRKDVVDKITSTRYNHYYNNLFTNEKFKNIIEPMFSVEEFDGSESHPYMWKCKKCGSIFEDTISHGKIPRCLNCYPLMGGNSNLQKEIAAFFEENEIEIEQNNRSIISPLEIDIYIPKFKIGIEFNGLFWHSELNGKDKYYHLNKTKKCRKLGIQLIHIFEDEWIEQREIVKSFLLSKVNIYSNRIFGRKCEIVEIENADDFYEQNHLMGKSAGTANVALKYNDEIVSMMSFARSRFNNDYEWELTRFANSKNTLVIGGFSKLLSYFIKTYNPKSIITYADLRYTYGDVYLKNKFILEAKNNPDYYYTDYKHRFDRRGFQKQYLSKKIKEYDPSLTEWENMQLNGWDRIWDCGTYRYILIR